MPKLCPPPLLLTRGLRAGSAAFALMAALASPALADAHEMDAFCGQAQLSPLSRITCSDPALRQLSLDRNDIFETANDQLDPEQYQKLLANQRSWLGRVAERCAAAYDLIPLATKQDCVRHAGIARKHDLISYANGKDIPDVARVDTPKWGELRKDLAWVPPPHAEPPKNKTPCGGWVPQAEWPQEAVPLPAGPPAKAPPPPGFAETLLPQAQ